MGVWFDGLSNLWPAIYRIRDFLTSFLSSSVSERNNIHWWSLRPDQSLSMILARVRFTRWCDQSLKIVDWRLFFIPKISDWIPNTHLPRIVSESIRPTNRWWQMISELHLVQELAKWMNSIIKWHLFLTSSATESQSRLVKRNKNTSTAKYLVVFIAMRAVQCF